MVKAYLRYEFSGAFGVVSSNSNVVYDNDGKTLITASLENISVWSVKQANRVRESWWRAARSAWRRKSSRTADT